jgi:hypothetical protein
LHLCASRKATCLLPLAATAPAEGDAGPSTRGGGAAGSSPELGEEGEEAEAAFLLSHDALPSLPEPALPPHLRRQLLRLVQDPGGRPRGAAPGALVAAPPSLPREAASPTAPLPVSSLAPAPVLTPGQRQWVAFGAVAAGLMLWSLPGLWATCHSAKYAASAELEEASRELLER